MDLRRIPNNSALVVGTYVREGSCIYQRSGGLVSEISTIGTCGTAGKGWDSNPRRQINCLYALAKRRFQPTQPPFLIAAPGEIGTYDGGRDYGV